MTRRFLGFLLIFATLATGALAGSPQRASTDGPVTLQLRRVFKDVYRPKRVKVSNDGSVYLMSTDDHSIVRIEPGGASRRIGRIGNGRGELFQPIDFDVDDKGGVCVADRGNDRVACFESTGEYASAFAVKGTPLSITHLKKDIWGVVAVHSRSVVMAYSQLGQPRGVFGEVHQVEGANARQRAYLSRPHVASLGDGSEILCLYGRLLPPRLSRYGPTNNRIKEVSLLDLIPTTLLNDSRRYYARSLPQGQLAYSETANVIAVEPERRNLLLGLPTPLVYRIDVDGRVLGSWTPMTEDGRQVALTDIAVTRRGTGYGISGSLGVFEFDLPR